MKTITQITKKGKKGRYNVYVDDEFFGIYEDEILAKHQIKTGDTFDESFLEKLKIENGDYACFNRSLSLLEKSMKTEKMLKQYLKEKLYPDECIERAVEKLKDYGYINDESFCECYINSSKYTKSKRKIKFELLNKGVKEEIVDEKIESLLDDDEEEMLCLKIAKKYMNNKECDIKNKQKLYNHLVSKGFSYSLFSRIWEEIVNDRG